VQPRALLQRSRHQKLNKNSKKGEIGQFLNSNRVDRITAKITQQPLCEKIHNLLLGPNFPPYRTFRNESELRVTIFAFTIHQALHKLH
jgi:hypothetical protein